MGGQEGNLYITLCGGELDLNLATMFCKVNFLLPETTDNTPRLVAKDANSFYYYTKEGCARIRGVKEIRVFEFEQITAIEAMIEDNISSPSPPPKKKQRN